MSCGVGRHWRCSGPAVLGSIGGLIWLNGGGGGGALEIQWGCEEMGGGTGDLVGLLVWEALEI